MVYFRDRTAALHQPAPSRRDRAGARCRVYAMVGADGGARGRGRSDGRHDTPSVPDGRLAPAPSAGRQLKCAAGRCLRFNASLTQRKWCGRIGV